MGCRHLVEMLTPPGGLTVAGRPTGRAVSACEQSAVESGEAIVT